MQSLNSDDEMCRSSSTFSSRTTSLHSTDTDSFHIDYVDKDSRKSMINQNHLTLKRDQAELQHQLNALKMEMSALRIKSDHVEETLKKMQEQSHDELLQSQAIKPNLLNGAQRALDAQKPVDFPNEFLTTIFGVHADDANFRDHCKQIDIELKNSVLKLGDHAYQAEKDFINEIMIHKMESLREKLKNKYKAKLMRREQEQLDNLIMLKSKCFQLLEQFIIEQSRGENEQYIKSFLKQLKQLYEQESEDP